MEGARGGILSLRPVEMDAAAGDPARGPLWRRKISLALAQEVLRASVTRAPVGPPPPGCCAGGAGAADTPQPDIAAPWR